MADVPPSASEHPATWTFDYPIHHAETREAWRAWLEAHQSDTPGVWLASWKPATGRPAVGYEATVEEALCVGWIDSTVNTLDDERALQLVTPRRPRSPWSRSNKQRVARLEAAGRLGPRGREVIEAARSNGWWTIYDAVEDLREPDDLTASLDASPAARTTWDGFLFSARKQMLWWVISAVKPETRARRIARVVADAAEGRRAQG